MHCEIQILVVRLNASQRKGYFMSDYCVAFLDILGFSNYVNEDLNGALKLLKSYNNQINFLFNK